MKKLAVLLLIILFFGVGMRNVDVADASMSPAQTPNQEFRVGDKMPDYGSGTTCQGHKFFENEQSTCFVVTDSHFEASIRKLYTAIFPAVLIGDQPFPLPGAPPFIIIVVSNNIVALIDIVDRDGKKEPDGIIDEVIVFSETSVEIDPFPYHPYCK